MAAKIEHGGKGRARGRPAEFDRAAALQAAMDAFWKRGFEATSVSDLAAAMSITRSSFYNSFGDRETVFLEVLDAYRRIAPDAALAAIRPGQPVKPAVRKVFKDICRVRAADLDARGCLVVNSIGELVGVNTDLGDRIEQALRDAVQGYARLLRQAANQDEIDRPKDIEAMARAFVAFTIGLNAISKVIRDEGELWRLSQVFLDGVGFGRDPALR